MTTIDLACYDASCAPPPVGTGGSKPGGPARGVLSPKRTGRKNEPQAVVPDIYELRRHGLRETFDGTLPGTDLVFDEVDVQWHSDYGWAIEGRLRNESGDLVAYFERSVNMVDGKLVAHHDVLRVEEEHQGKGYAQAFNNHVLDWYQKIGVDRIELIAGHEVGPYAWATQGYRIMGEGGENRKRWVSDRIIKIRQLVERRELAGKVSGGDRLLLNMELNALAKASSTGEDVQPIHIASIGQDNPKLHWKDKTFGDMWPGKAVLVEKDYHGSDDNSRSWDGVYYLEGKETPATVASAVRNLQRA